MFAGIWAKLLHQAGLAGRVRVPVLLLLIGPEIEDENPVLDEVVAQREMVRVGSGLAQLAPETVDAQRQASALVRHLPGRSLRMGSFPSRFHGFQEWPASLACRLLN